jgi:hypothetical protein
LAYIARSADDGTTLLQANVASATPVFHSNKATIREAVPIDAGRVAILLEQGDPNSEVDVCVAPTGGHEIALPIRDVPKAMVAYVEKAKPLLTGDLSGAKVTTETGLYSSIVFTAPGSGPSSDDALRARVNEVQSKVTASTADATLGVELVYTGNSRDAVSAWREGGDKFYVGAGDKGKLLYDRSQFGVEADPGTLLTYHDDGSYVADKTSRFGSYSCRGKVKNTGAKPLALTVRCSLSVTYVGTEAESAPLKPSPLPPGATAKYDFYVGAGQDSTTVRLEILADGKPIPFFNLFSDRKARGQDH